LFFINGLHYWPAYCFVLGVRIKKQSKEFKNG